MEFLNKLFGRSTSKLSPEPAYAFVSYSKADKGIVQQFESYLVREELSPWRDNQIELGDTWEDLILNRIRGCKVFLVVMSPNSRKSTFVKREIDIAFSQKKMIIPILLEGEPFEELRNFQYVVLKSFWYSNMPLVERLRIILTPDQIPSTHLQRRRIEQVILLFFESILGDSNPTPRVFLGVGFDITFSVSLKDSLRELDELDWTEVFIELSRMFPRQNFNFHIGDDYGSQFPTIGHLVDYLDKKLTWNDIRHISIRYKPGNIGVEE